MESKEDLERDLRAAFQGIVGVGGKASAGAEKRYGEAYQALVRNGYRPQIRRKYRG